MRSGVALINEMNDCLEKLDLEDDLVSDQFSFDKLNQSLPGDLGVSNSSMSPISHLRGSNQQLLFNQQLRNQEGTQSSPQINIELFREKIKQALGQMSPNDRRNQTDDEEGEVDPKMPSQFSTNYKSKNPYKSRQISIHTNAFLATDTGDNSSQRQEMFSTARTTQMGSIKNHQRTTSNTKSFFTQTPAENTFISYDNNLLNEQLQTVQEFDDPNSDETFLQKYQEGVKNYFNNLNIEKKKQKKRLVTHDLDLKLRPTLKRKIRSVVSDPALVPMNIFFTIISYDGKMFRKFLGLSHGMKKHLLFHVFESTQKLSKDFQKKYGQVFQVESRMLTMTPISFGGEEGSRLEMSMKVKVKKEAKKLEGRSVIIGNSYNLEAIREEQLNEESRIEGEFQTLYQFDLYKAKSQRWLWLHKDESLFHGFTDARAYTIPIVPICTEDSFELSVTLLSLMGALDVNSVKWHNLKIDALPNQNDIRDYNRFKNLTPNRDLLAKYFADLKRVCEVEDTVCEWYDEPYVKVQSLSKHIRRKVDIEQFIEQFDILKVEIGGLDFSVWKIQMKAKKKPLIEYKFYPELNIGITCSQDQPLSNEIKRTGFLIDRGQDLELRSGDILLAYISMGGFEK